MYHYFEYGRQGDHTLRNVILNLIKQVALKYRSSFSECFKPLYESLVLERRALSVEELERYFVTIVRRCKKLFLVIDALDECEAYDQRRQFLELLNRLSQLSQMRILVTSRPQCLDIREAFSHGLKIDIKAQDCDLRKYLSDQIARSDVSNDIDATFREEMIVHLTRYAHGM